MLKLVMIVILPFIFLTAYSKEKITTTNEILNLNESVLISFDKENRLRVQCVGLEYRIQATEGIFNLLDAEGNKVLEDQFDFDFVKEEAIDHNQRVLKKAKAKKNELVFSGDSVTVTVDKAGNRVKYKCVGGIKYNVRSKDNKYYLIDSDENKILEDIGYKDAKQIASELNLENWND